MTAPAATTPPAIVSVHADRLVALLRDIVRASSSAPTFEVLGGVQLYTGGDRRLVASATDRFVALHGHTDVIGGDLPLVWLTTPQVRQILTVLRPVASRRASLVEVTIAVADGKVTIRQEALDDLGAAGLTFPHSTGPDGFPDLVKMITTHAAAAPNAEQWAVEPVRLLLFAQIAKARGERMRVSSRGATRPVIIQIGDDLVGIVMPVRLGSEREATLSVPVYGPPVLAEQGA